MILSAPICRVLLVAFGCAVPAYLTHKAVSSDNTVQLRHWCIYWLLMGFFLCLEWAADLTIFWLPLYYEAKLAFVIALWHPRTHAAVTLYDSYMLPLLRKHEAGIDRFFEECRGRVADTVSSNVNAAHGYLQNHAGTIMQGLKSFSEQKPAGGSAAGGSGGHHKAQ